MLAQGKLDTLLNRFAEIEHRMSSNPDAATYVRLSREYAEIEPLVRAVQALRKAEEELAGAEAMIEAGVHQGLSRGAATELVNQTFVGAGAMLSESGHSATELREMVTSPAGTTAAALRALDDHGVRSGILAAVEACTLRSEEMSGL